MCQNQCPVPCLLRPVKLITLGSLLCCHIEVQCHHDYACQNNQPTSQPMNKKIPKPQWKHHSILLLPPNLMRLSLII